jgi:HTH-type transcriptional regulator/antitoxin HigA
VLLHSRRETFIDDGGGDHGDAEEEANAFAERLLIPEDAAKRLPTLRTDRDVEAFANELGIAPGIVVGRLHNDRHWTGAAGTDYGRRLSIIENT